MQQFHRGNFLEYTAAYPTRYARWVQQINYVSVPVTDSQMIPMNGHSTHSGTVPTTENPARLAKNRSDSSAWISLLSQVSISS